MLQKREKRALHGGFSFPTSSLAFTLVLPWPPFLGQKTVSRQPAQQGWESHCSWGQCPAVLGFPVVEKQRELREGWTDYRSSAWPFPAQDPHIILPPQTSSEVRRAGIQDPRHTALGQGAGLKDPKQGHRNVYSGNPALCRAGNTFCQGRKRERFRRKFQDV
jgi:hypothetical protein